MPEIPPSPNPEARPTDVTGLLLTGEGLANITPERVAMLSEMVGGLGLQIAAIQDEEMLRSQREEPTAVTQQSFIDFATEAGYSNRRAHSAWRTVVREGNPRYTRRVEGEIDPYPPIKFLNPGGPDTAEEGAIVDLRSVHKRLVASAVTHAAWEGLTKRQLGTVSFLAQLVDAKLNSAG